MKREADGQWEYLPDRQKREAEAEIARLRAEVARLAGLLAPLVAKRPLAWDDGDGPYCAYCEGDQYPRIEHEPDCPWAAASEALGEDG